MTQLSGGLMETISFETLNAAEQIANRLRALTDSLSSESISKLFYTRVRVKSVDSIKEKLYRKRHIDQKLYYNFYNLTDIVGIRLVTLYDDDLIPAFDTVLDLINLGMIGREPLFCGGNVFSALQEANLYDRQVAVVGETSLYMSFYQHILGRLEEYCPARGRKTREIHRKIRDNINYGQAADKQYSSAHFVFEATGYYKSVEIKMPIEVQIRTAAEDIWSEINHKLLYKTKTPYIWSPDISDTHDELERDSTDLKTSIESLSSVISRFIDHSDRVLEFKNNFRIPTTKVHNSLVVSLMTSMSHRLLPDAGNNIDSYDQKIRRIRQFYEKSTFENHANDALALVDEVDNEIDTISRGDISGTDELLCSVRKSLLEFERSRLRCLIIFSKLRRSKSYDDPQRVSRSDIENLEKEFQYLCEFKNDKSALVRPISVISYWKYLIQKNINQDTAMKYLYIAREELEIDVALPDWSIYRVLIPKTLAVQLVLEVERFLAPHDGSENTSSQGENTQQISQSILHDTEYKLVSAFDNAIYAYYYSKEGDGRRGDLIFEGKKVNMYEEARLVLHIFILYWEIYNQEVRCYSPEREREFFKMLVKMKHKFQKRSPKNEMARKVHQLLTRALDIRSKIES